MGYTHYYHTLAANQQLIDFARQAVKLSKVRICDASGEGNAVLEDGTISLNGSRNDWEDCEEFYLTDNPAGSWQSCKTERLPYDEVVTAILIAAIRMQCKGYESISSDGSIADWIHSGGVKLFCKTWESLYDSEALTDDLVDHLCAQIGGRPEELYPFRQTGTADAILEVFQKFMVEHNIYVPSSVAEATADHQQFTAGVYGKDKEELLDSITDVLEQDKE